MAEHGWSPSQMLQMTPAQVMNAWAAWKVRELERLREMTWAEGIAKDPKQWKKQLDKMET